jgi:hypothetical protein
MTNQAPVDQARTFLSRVLTWPAADEPGYCNLHWTTTRKHPQSGQYLWGGTPARTLDEMMKNLAYATRADTVRDVYFCLSVQAEVEEKMVAATGRKFRAALRNQRNALSMRVVAIDMDFKGGVNGYDSEADATAALIEFLKATKLPRPTIIVKSGGGMHLYWVFDRALTPAEWTPISFAMAEATKRHGLKCDTQCTVDIARILRVPGTFNLKQAQPRPVTLASILPTDYPVERLTSVLGDYQTHLPPAPLLPARKALVGTSDLAAGIDQSASMPIDLRSVLKECGFLRDAVKTAGQNLANPLWNITTLLATFTGNGRVNAHLMARGHPGYSKESTDDLYDRKEREKDTKGLGWPACATISANGAHQCQLCPRFVENKTPLHFGDRIQPKVPIAPGVAPTPTANSTIQPSKIPAGYSQRSDGVILYLKEGEDGQKTWLPVIRYPMTKPWLQRDPWIFNFTTKGEVGKEHQVAIETATLDTADMRKSLQSQGVLIDGTTEYKNIGKLIMSWVAHLQNMKDAVVSSHPFGWNVKNGAVQGFIYGGASHGPTGSLPSANPDPVIASQYTPTGDRKLWIDAAEMITAQMRPELDAIIASSFGAPLVRFTGQSGMLMSCYSVESGIGKSTTLRIAQAVWGDPVRAMQSLADTQNSVLHKIGEIRSLPLYWDELKTEQDSKKFVNVVFTIGQGKEKSRLNSRASQRAPGTWQTLLVSASNESLLDIVEEQTRATTAGIYRVFEYEVTPPGKKGQIDPSDAQRKVAKLTDNYGQIGLEYAEFLGQNYHTVEAEVAALNRALGTETQTNPDERFWVATVCCILAGAKYANQLGYTKIDEGRLKAFLLGVLAKMRGVRNNATVDMKDSFNVSNVMSQFFSDMRYRHTMFTNVCRTAIGKPAAGTIQMIGDHTRLESVFVRVGVNDKIVRISSTQFSKWLADNRHPRSIMMKALTDKYQAAIVKARIASGTTFAGPQEYCIEIDLLNAKEINFIDEA